MFLKSIVTSLFILFIFNTILFSQNERLARFEYVRYEGNEDYYSEHPLDDGKFYNPILPGFYPDPSICQKGDDFYLVTSTFSFFPGVPVFHSNDLVHWKQLGHVLDRPSQYLNSNQSVSSGIYAPAIAYNSHNDTFYMTTTDVRGNGNFVVKTKDPAGPWSDPIGLPEVAGIDPSLFFDEDGKAYLTNNEDPVGGSLYPGHKATWIQEYDVENDKMIGPRVMIRNGGHNLAEQPIWIEGPHIYKVNGYYYLMAAEGGTSINHSQVIFRSKDIFGPYQTNPDNPILTQRDLPADRKFPITNAGHADLIQTKDGRWYATFLACRPYSEKNEFNIGRETFILPVSWEGDWPVILEDKLEIPMQVDIPAMAHQTKAEGGHFMPKGNFAWHEDFGGDTLGHDWFFLRTPQEKWYKQDGRGIQLKLRPVNMRQYSQPSFIGRRQQHHNFTLETKMIFEPQADKELAGLVLFQSEAHHYIFGVSQMDGDNYLVVKKAKKVAVQTNSSANKPITKEVVLASRQLPDNFDGEVLLRISIKDTKMHFAANHNGQWEELLTGENANYLSTSEAGGFIGTVMGLYASSND